MDKNTLSICNATRHWLQKVGEGIPTVASVPAKSKTEY